MVTKQGLSKGTRVGDSMWRKGWMFMQQPRLAVDARRSRGGPGII